MKGTEYMYQDKWFGEYMCICVCVCVCISRESRVEFIVGIKLLGFKIQSGKLKRAVFRKISKVREEIRVGCIWNSLQNKMSLLLLFYIRDFS